MATSPRVFVVAALAVGPLLLAAGCGSEASGSRTTLQTVQNTSYVVQDPITTTTTTSLPSNATTPAGEISPTEQTYTVVSGDSVYRIAGLFDLDPVVLANYNAWPEGVQHPLLVGDQVKIPPNAIVPGTGTGSGSGTDTGSGAGSGTTPPSGTEPAGEGCTHTIVAGDNPTRVAEQYDIPVAELEAANAGNPVWNSFLLGSQLTIPPGGDC